jgi:hypothetical protein
MDIRLIYYYIPIWYIVQIYYLLNQKQVLCHLTLVKVSI